MTDWQDAQVIEVTNDLGTEVLYRDPRRVVTFCRFDGQRVSMIAEFSDVRVIVDADGRVSSPQITDEMVKRAAVAMDDAWDGEEFNFGTLARIALTAALGQA